MAFGECIFNLLSLSSKIVKIFVIEEVSGLTHAQIPVLHQAEPQTSYFHAQKTGLVHV